jgi:predicted porin
MKKTLLTLVIANALGASAAVQADTTLYGSARVSVDYDKLKAPKDATFSDPPGSWDIDPNNSRLGVKGEEDLGAGLSAIYQFEFGVDVTEGGNFKSNRPKWVGLKSDFGSLTLGTQYTPYYDVVGLTDYFNSLKTYDWDIFLYPDAATRENNSVMYKTPDLKGFTFEAMAIMDTQYESGTTVDITPRSGIDRWNLMGLYQNGPFTGGLTYASFPSCQNCFKVDEDDYLFGLALGLQFGNFTVNFTHEQGDASSIYGEAKNYLLLASYAIGNTDLAATYGYIDPDKGDHVDYFVVGAQHKLSKRTRLWVEYYGRRDDNSITNPDLIALGDRDVVSIGVRHDF